VTNGNKVAKSDSDEVNTVLCFAIEKLNANFIFVGTFAVGYLLFKDERQQIVFVFGVPVGVFTIWDLLLLLQKVVLILIPIVE